MTLPAGTRLGPYEITSSIGAGGMGEVYRAKDTRLGREVAIKVSAEQFSERFEREARAIAALNHANVCTLHDVGPDYLVMELVDGPTLAERLAELTRSQARVSGMPLDEALAIASQIANALEAAHEKGIIHRDLKPANIKITPDGGVKVLDFGLAKIGESETAAAGLSHSPTMMRASVPGMILGTAGYMSPEQAKGLPADRSSDVWAFGCVLYEMLTGRRVFDGGSVSEILADVLKSEPEWIQLPPGTPEAIRRLLRRCLQKDRKLRLHDMADVRIEIADALSEPMPPQVPTLAAPGRSRRKERIAWLSALALVALVAAGAVIRVFRPVRGASEMRVEITTPPTMDAVSIAISPDGQKIVFVATSEGRSRLWLRPLDAVAARPMEGTDDASFPFWSPDSRSVGFFAEGLLKRVDVAGGPPQVVVKASRGYRGLWTADGAIYFSPTGVSPILKVSSAGGEPAIVTRLETGQTAHRYPHILPDDRHLLYSAIGSPEVRGVYVSRIDGSEARRLIAADGAATFLRSGHLLFVRQGTLVAQPFDPVSVKPSGDSFPVADQVAFDSFLNFAAVSASAMGSIIYRTGSAGGRRQPAWFDRSGREIARVGDPDAAAPLNPSMSPDGRRVAVNRSVAGNTDIWLLDTTRGVSNRFTFDAAMENFPIWAPDGQRIAFSSGRTGVYDLYSKSLAGSGNEELLLASAEIKNPYDWSPDGRFVLYRTVSPTTGDDLWALPIDGDRKPVAVAQTNFEERDGQFSPDGKWIAYQSNESDRFEIYIQSFPGPGAKSRISTSGGAQVRWRGDGKELFYIAADGQLMAVSIRFAPDGQSVEAGASVPLFATRVGGFLQGINRQQYVVSPDGQRFLMNTVMEEPASPITLMLNWNPSR
jgi:Tol biopolymer transport system component/predicted Ser/Thr protein kinase